MYHVVELGPDIIKTDRSLIDGIAGDPARRSVVTAFVAVARDLNATVVAEGVERAVDLDAERNLGVGAAQGYLMARPSTDRREMVRWASQDLRPSSLPPTHPANSMRGRPGRERRARTWDRIPGLVTQDREWAVAVILLGAPAVADRTGPHVDFAGRTINWADLLLAASDWAEQDLLLVCTAFDLVAASRDPMTTDPRSRQVTMHEILTTDNEVADRVHAAFDFRLDSCDYPTALRRTGDRDSN